MENSTDKNFPDTSGLDDWHAMSEASSFVSLIKEMCAIEHRSHSRDGITKQSDWSERGSLDSRFIRWSM